MVGLFPGQLAPNEAVAIIKSVLSVWTDESGQDMAEYAILIDLVHLR